MATLKQHGQNRPHIYFLFNSVILYMTNVEGCIPIDEE